MTITLNYFAWLRERIGTGSEEVDLPTDVSTITELIDWLGTRGEEFSALTEHRDVIQVAINQEHCPDHSTSLENAREIALFPPMTGG